METGGKKVDEGPREDACDIESLGASETLRESTGVLVCCKPATPLD